MKRGNKKEMSLRKLIREDTNQGVGYNSDNAEHKNSLLSVAEKLMNVSKGTTSDHPPLTCP